MQRFFLFIPLIFLTLACTGSLDDKNIEETILKAEETYKEGLLEEDPIIAKELFFRSAVILEKISQDNSLTNAYLYYNIANSWFKADEIGKSIYYYKLAEKSLPGNEIIRQNLALARNTVEFVIVEEQPNFLLSTLLFFHYDISPDLKYKIIISLLFLLSLAGSILLFKKNIILKRVVLVLLPLAFLFIVSFLISNKPANEGVITYSVIGRNGDSEGYEPTFTEALPPGVEFSILEERFGWLYIELRDGRMTWIPSDAALLLD